MSDKTVVMKLWLSDDDYYEATFALVRLTPEVAQEVLGRIALARTLRAADPALHSLAYWDTRPVFSVRAALDEALAEQVDEQEYVVLDTPLQVAPDQVVEVESMRLIVTESDVVWKVYVKNTSISLETAWLPEALFREVAPE
jgi:hypothetical protein